MTRLRRVVRDIPKGPLIIGLLGRFLLAPYTAWNNDVAVWVHTAQAAFYGLHLYDRPGFTYPPVWGYFLEILGSFVRLAGFGPSVIGSQNTSFATASSLTGAFTTVVSSPGYNLLFKSILFGFDLATALLVFRVIVLVTGDFHRARIGFTLWFLNPFVVYESAVMGAFDGLVGFFVLTAVALAIYGREFGSGLAWMLAVMTKLSPLVLVLQLILVIALKSDQGTPSGLVRAGRVVAFATGAMLALACVLAPEVLFGSVPAMLHNVFIRTQSAVAMGGFSLTAVRYLKPFAWLLVWAYQNSSIVIQTSSIAQVAAVLGWAGWTLMGARRSPAFALLTGTVGTLASFTLLAPISNPQYVLWWLPCLVVVVVVTQKGWWHFAILTTAPLVYLFALLGPTAILAPFATYTHLFPASSINRDVIAWYFAPGKAYANSLPDLFFGPAVLGWIAALLSLFFLWFRTPRRMRRRFANPSPPTPSGTVRD